jgi:GNAT superfamily N-acetyltransferase
MRIREAEPKDARAIAEIHVASWQAAYRGQLTDDYLDGLTIEGRLEQHRRTLEEPRAEWRTWMAEDEGRVVAFAVTGPSEDADADDRTGELYAIYLDPERVGTGLGRTLFRARRRRSAGARVHERPLSPRTNRRARRFYEIAGWLPDGTVTSERVDCEMRPTVRYRATL